MDHKHAVDATMAVSRMRRDITDDDFHSIRGDNTGKPFTPNPNLKPQNLNKNLKNSIKGDDRSVDSCGTHATGYHGRRLLRYSRQ